MASKQIHFFFIMVYDLSLRSNFFSSYPFLQMIPSPLAEGRLSSLMKMFPKVFSFLTNNFFHIACFSVSQIVRSMVSHLYKIDDNLSLIQLLEKPSSNSTLLLTFSVRSIFSPDESQSTSVFCL